MSQPFSDEVVLKREVLALERERNEAVAVIELLHSGRSH